jgi:hypothetical protein
VAINRRRMEAFIMWNPRMEQRRVEGKQPLGRIRCDEVVRESKKPGSKPGFEAPS